jgi:hypothetical protein
MRRVAFVLLLALASQLFMPTAANAGVPGFDSSYMGESDFQTVDLSATSPQSFTVFFMNTGTLPWVKGSSLEVVLAVCLDDKITCNVDSPHREWGVGYWVSPRVYAGPAQQVVEPGRVATFSWSFHAPPAPPAGDYVFHGDLMHRASGRMIHPEGYYQTAVCDLDQCG